MADQPQYLSGDPMLAVDGDLHVRAWNRAVERLTGVPASEAIGRPCWQLLGGRGPDGSIICHVHCLHARLAWSGWAVRCFDADIHASGDARRVTFSTVVVREHDGPMLIHLLRDAAAAATDDRPGDCGVAEATRLTRRQLEVFNLMGAGAAAKVISSRLGVTEATVRNHIRAILVELRCNSQLAAVAKGRALGVIR